MNDKTKIMYNLARMYEFIKDIDDICKEHDNDYMALISNKTTKHAINMCLVQMGEQSARIRDVDKEFYKANEDLKLSQIKGMRDRITHSYGDIDYSIIKETLEKDIPSIKSFIEQTVDKEVLDNPYVLHEVEYDDYVVNK